MNSNLTIALEWVAKILSMMIIPTLFWLNTLEVERAIQAQSIKILQEKVAKQEDELSKVKGLVSKNAAMLGKIQVTLENMSTTLNEVRNAMRTHESLHLTGTTRR
jgi:uncharacterized coiled-coil protein SlyX